MSSNNSPTTPPRFPRITHIYKSTHDPNTFILARTPDDPNPHSICTTSPEFHLNKPNLALHSTADPLSDFLATGIHISFTHTTQLHLHAPSPSSSPNKESKSVVTTPPKTTPTSITLEPGEASPIKNFFIYSLSCRGNLEERFEWRSTNGYECNEIKRLGDVCKGMTLIRRLTGQPVAAWGMGKCGWSRRKVAGRLGFFGRDLGEEFETVAVMSLLALLCPLNGGGGSFWGLGRFGGIGMEERFV